jgi:hypothetical protein
MTNFQMLALGMMAVWMPSLVILVVLGYFLSRAPVAEKKTEQMSRLPRSPSVEVPGLCVEDTTLQPQEYDQNNCPPQSGVGDCAGQESRYRGTT